MNLITTTSALEAACRAMAASPFVAVDTEFMRETTFWPKLCLIQLATAEVEAVVDPLAPGLSLDPFYKLMSNDKVVKVFHAARQDVEIVFIQAGVIPTPLFDTQVAAMVCGFGELISYVNLVNRSPMSISTSRLALPIGAGGRFPRSSSRTRSEMSPTYDASMSGCRAILNAPAAADGWTRNSGVLTDPGSYKVEPEDSWRRLKLKVRGRRVLPS